MTQSQAWRIEDESAEEPLDEATGAAPDVATILAPFDSALDELAAESQTHLKSLARSLAFRLVEAERRIHMFENMNSRDPLTGLLNGRGFVEQMTRALAEAERHDESGLLLRINIDGFKEANARYGFPGGDALLMAAADRMKALARRTDIVARLEADDFAVVLTRAQVAPAISRAQTIEDALGVTSARFSGRMIRMRATVGVEPYGPGADLSLLMHRAEADLRRRRHARAASQETPLAAAG